MPSTHLFVFFPAFECRDNLLVEPCGDGFRFDDFWWRWRRFEQAVVFVRVAVLAAARQNGLKKEEEMDRERDREKKIKV